MTTTNPRPWARSILLLLTTAPAGLAQATQLGGTTLPLGDDAYPSVVECLTVNGICGDGISPNSGPPQYEFFGTLQTLLATHPLDGILVDVDVDQHLRLQFTIPIENQPGPDVYLGQAWFFGNDLGLGAADVNGFDVSLDGNAWSPVAASRFARDDVAGTNPFYYTDGGPVEGAAFDLWFAFMDLGELGLAAGQQTSELHLRAREVGTQEDEKLDIVAVVSLNEPCAPSGCPQPYCAGKTNSLGCIPFLTFQGVPSTTATSTFRVVANQALPNESRLPALFPAEVQPELPRRQALREVADRATAPAEGCSQHRSAPVPRRARAERQQHDPSRKPPAPDGWPARACPVASAGSRGPGGLWRLTDQCPPVHDCALIRTVRESRSCVRQHKASARSCGTAWPGRPARHRSSPRRPSPPAAFRPPGPPVPRSCRLPRP